MAEIPIPGRMLIGNRTHNLVITSDGKKALIYNMQPSSSVNVVDLDKRAFEQKIELPGCATMLTNTINGFSALCSNGTMATVAMDGQARHHPFGALLLGHGRSDLRHLDPGSQDRQGDLVEL